MATGVLWDPMEWICAHSSHLRASSLNHGLWALEDEHAVVFSAA